MLEYWLALAIVQSLSLAPKPLADRLARLYARILDVAIPRLRRVGMRNLELAMPELDADRHRQIIDGVFRSLARTVAAFAKFPSIHKGNVGEWIRYEGYEHFERALADGRGVLFATAHLGNWE